MADQTATLDQELHQILEGATQHAPLAIELPAIQPHHAAIWPWQVAQVQTVTTDRTPGSDG
jgi:hypothetical protein